MKYCTMHVAYRTMNGGKCANRTLTATVADVAKANNDWTNTYTYSFVCVLGRVVVEVAAVVDG